MAVPEGILEVEECEWVGAVADFEDGTLPAEQDSVTVDGADGTQMYVQEVIAESGDVGVTLRLRKV